jgi:hypothetical protein
MQLQTHIVVTSFKVKPVLYFLYDADWNSKITAAAF